MNSLPILESVQQAFTQALTQSKDAFDAEVTHQHATDLLKTLTQMLKTTVLHAFSLWLLQAECHENKVQHNGLWYHYKIDSSREFLTPLGSITLTRRLFQTADCQHSYVPMDAAWGMVDQYAMLGVQQIVTKMMGRMIPDDIAAVLSEVGLFTVGTTTMRKWAAEFGICWKRIRKRSSRCARTK